MKRIYYFLVVFGLLLGTTVMTSCDDGNTDGIEDGSNIGSGDENGNGDGNGSGNGDGDGNTDGSGDENGNGDGNGDGEGSSEETLSNTYFKINDKIEEILAATYFSYDVEGTDIYCFYFSPRENENFNITLKESITVWMLEADFDQTIDLSSDSSEDWQVIYTYYTKSTAPGIEPEIDFRLGVLNENLADKGTMTATKDDNGIFTFDIDLKYEEYTLKMKYDGEIPAMF